jgi:hypothetical protein
LSTWNIQPGTDTRDMLEETAWTCSQPGHARGRRRLCVVC